MTDHHTPPLQSVYLDNNATTDLDPKVRRLMQLALKQFCGNPSSAHSVGAGSRHTVETCRHACARWLECRPEEVYFTSGATESNNMVLQGFIRQAHQQGRKPRVLVAPIEHVSVLNPLRQCHDTIELVECPVDSQGRVDPLVVESLIVQHRIELLSVALVNHEVGTVQDLQALARVAHRHGVLVHSDYTQAVGKFPVFPEVDAVSFSAHKFYGPKGVGGLVVRAHARPRLAQLMFGGDQEMQLRPGTENVLGIVGLTAALELAVRRRTPDLRHLDRLALRLCRGLTAQHIPYVVNSASAIALNLSFPHSKLSSDELLQRLSTAGICVSKGAACKSRTRQDSYVLAAMGVTPQGPNIRVGLGRFNRAADVDVLLHALHQLL